MNDAFLPRSDWTQRGTTAGRRVVDSAARVYPRILGFDMMLTNVASKLMHASSFAARFNKGSAHHADIVRVAQELRIPSIPPILPPAMIVVESRAGWGSFRVPRTPSSQECR
jgi:hypothetical protein